MNETFKAGDLILIRPGANLHEQGSPRPMSWKTVTFQTKCQPALVIAQHTSGPFVDERGDELVVLTLGGSVFYVYSEFVTHVEGFDAEVLLWNPRRANEDMMPIK